MTACFFNDILHTLFTWEPFDDSISFVVMPYCHDMDGHVDFKSNMVKYISCKS